MVDITRPEYGQVWASEGETLEPASTKMELGWVQEMMPFQWENFLQNRQDVAITYLLQKGIPEYSATQEYIAQKSAVLYQGAVYLATQTTTGVLPSVSSSWKRLSAVTDSSGVVTVAGGGTGATTAAQARTNLGLGTAATLNSETIVQKDVDGNFSAGNITATLLGNATTSDKWKTARTINIAGAVTSDTKSIDGTSNTTLTVSELDATKLVGIAPISVTGNAGSATKWSTPRTVSITGSASGTSNPSDGSSNFEINVTSLNASSLSSGTVPASVLTNAVTKTSQTGSAIFPSGTTAQRDDPAQEAFFRYNRTTKLPEYYDGIGWKAVTGLNAGGFASSTDLSVANAKIIALENELSSKVGSVILYPGGTAEAPANIAVNQTIEVVNPYPGKSVTCRAEVFHLGEWCTTGWMFSAVGYGVAASQRGDNIYVQSGGGIAARRQYGGGSINLTSAELVTPLPFRVVISLDGGVDA